MFKFFLYKLGLFVLNRLSLQSSYSFGVFLSDLKHCVSLRDRRAVGRNFQRIFPGRKVAGREVREVFRNFGRYLVEFFKAQDLLTDQTLKTRVRLEGIEHLNEVIQGGKGGIIVTAHIGTWEVGAMIMSMLGYPVTVVALPHKERSVNELFDRQRASKGVLVIPTSIAVRRIIEHLRDNRLVALVADRDFGESGFVMDFLGHPTLLPKGPAIFSWKTGAPLIPVYCIRNADGTITLSCEKPINPPLHERDEKADEETLKGMMRRYLPSVEDRIRSHPSQWLLFRDFSVS